MMSKEKHTFEFHHSPSGSEVEILSIGRNELRVKLPEKCIIHKIGLHAHSGSLAGTVISKVSGKPSISVSESDYSSEEPDEQKPDVTETWEPIAIVEKKDNAFPSMLTETSVFVVAVVAQLSISISVDAQSLLRNCGGHFSVFVDAMPLSAQPPASKVIVLLNICDELVRQRREKDAVVACMHCGMALLSSRRFVQASEFFHLAMDHLRKSVSESSRIFLGRIDKILSGNEGIGEEEEEEEEEEEDATGDFPPEMNVSLATAAKISVLSANAMQQHGQLYEAIRCFREAVTYYKAGKVQYESIHEITDVSKALLLLQPGLVDMLLDMLQDENIGVRLAASKSMSFILDTIGCSTGEQFVSVLKRVIHVFDIESEQEARDLHVAAENDTSFHVSTDLDVSRDVIGPRSNPVIDSLLKLLETCHNMIPYFKNEIIIRIQNDVLESYITQNVTSEQFGIQLIRLFSSTIIRLGGDCKSASLPYLSFLLRLHHEPSDALSNAARKSWVSISARLAFRFCDPVELLHFVEWCSEEIRHLHEENDEICLSILVHFVNLVSETVIRKDLSICGTKLLPVGSTFCLLLPVISDILLIESDKENLSLFLSLWGCFEHICMAIRTPFRPKVNDVLVTILEKVYTHCEFSSPTKPMLLALKTILAHVKPDQELCEYLNRFLLRFGRWVPLNIHVETFEVLDEILHILGDSIHPKTFAMMLEHLLDINTTKCKTQKEVQQTVRNIILHPSTTHDEWCGELEPSLPDGMGDEGSKFIHLHVLFSMGLYGHTKWINEEGFSRSATQFKKQHVIDDFHEVIHLMSHVIEGFDGSHDSYVIASSELFSSACMELIKHTNSKMRMLVLGVARKFAASVSHSIMRQKEHTSDEILTKIVGHAIDVASFSVEHFSNDFDVLFSSLQYVFELLDFFSSDLIGEACVSQIMSQKGLHLWNQVSFFISSPWRNIQLLAVNLLSKFVANGCLEVCHSSVGETCLSMLSSLDSECQRCGIEIAKLLFERVMGSEDKSAEAAVLWRKIFYETNHIAHSSWNATLCRECVELSSQIETQMSMQDVDDEPSASADAWTRLVVASNLPQKLVFVDDESFKEGGESATTTFVHSLGEEQPAVELEATIEIPTKLWGYVGQVEAEATHYEDFIEGETVSADEGDEVESIQFRDGFMDYTFVPYREEDFDVDDLGIIDIDEEDEDGSRERIEYVPPQSSIVKYRGRLWDRRRPKPRPATPPQGFEKGVRQGSTLQISCERRARTSEREARKTEENAEEEEGEEGEGIIAKFVYDRRYDRGEPQTGVEYKDDAKEGERQDADKGVAVVISQDGLTKEEKTQGDNPQDGSIALPMEEERAIHEIGDLARSTTPEEISDFDLDDGNGRTTYALLSGSSSDADSDLETEYIYVEGAIDVIGQMREEERDTMTRLPEGVMVYDEEDEDIEDDSLLALDRGGMDDEDVVFYRDESDDDDDVASEDAEGISDEDAVVAFVGDGDVEIGDAGDDADAEDDDTDSPMKEEAESTEEEHDEDNDGETDNGYNEGVREEGEVCDPIGESSARKLSIAGNEADIITDSNSVEKESKMEEEPIIQGISIPPQLRSLEGPTFVTEKVRDIDGCIHDRDDDDDDEMVVVDMGEENSVDSDIGSSTDIGADADDDVDADVDGNIDGSLDAEIEEKKFSSEVKATPKSNGILSGHDEGFSSDSEPLVSVDIHLVRDEQKKEGSIESGPLLISHHKGEEGEKEDVRGDVSESPQCTYGEEGAMKLEEVSDVQSRFMANVSSIIDQSPSKIGGKGDIDALSERDGVGRGRKGRGSCIRTSEEISAIDGEDHNVVVVDEPITVLHTLQERIEELKKKYNVGSTASKATGSPVSSTPYRGGTHYSPAKPSEISSLMRKYGVESLPRRSGTTLETSFLHTPSSTSRGRSFSSPIAPDFKVDYRDQFDDGKSSASRGIGSSRLTAILQKYSSSFDSPHREEQRTRLENARARTMHSLQEYMPPPHDYSMHKNSFKSSSLTTPSPHWRPDPQL
eukprot:TRINITY_DN909_c1_g1_i1.p1 TRINITY_DN909_c1_g1~~TRINITY_DN909_c1_g1_i1.p1  ORF type:complete len:2018 (+),score=615.87 TRINITY_DN909_c1_g1_i1:1457-7510(+)